MPASVVPEGGAVTPQPQLSQMPSLDDTVVIGREEKIEYRDEHGNLLNEEQVEALKGKVSFQTKYETRTRVVDADGKEIYVQEGPGVAPPHPDVEGPDSMTAASEEPMGEQGSPAEQPVAATDLVKEVRAEEQEAENAEAQPEEETPQATA